MQEPPRPQTRKTGSTELPLLLPEDVFAVHDDNVTLPVRPAFSDDDASADDGAEAQALLKDPAYGALAAWAVAQQASLAGCAWDRLAHLEAFSRALRCCTRGVDVSVPLHDDKSALLEGADALCARFRSSGARRLLIQLVERLLPSSGAPPLGDDEGMGGHHGEADRGLAPLPSSVLARAKSGFALVRGDVPRVAPPYGAHLAGDVAAAFAPSQPGVFLGPRGLSPGVACGNVVLLQADPTKPLARVDGKPALACVALQCDDEGAVIERVGVRQSAAGMPILDGARRPTELLVPFEQLATYLLMSGPGARGLDLRDADDRALLLTFCDALKSTAHEGRSLWRWLEDAGASWADRSYVVEACVHAAIDVVRRHTRTETRCAIALVIDDVEVGEDTWQRSALRSLEATGAVRVVEPWSTAVPGACSVLWLHALQPTRGFVAGRVSDVQQGAMLLRLLTTTLLPLGVLPMHGLPCGRGVVLVQRLWPAPPPDEATDASRDPSDHAGHDAAAPLVDAAMADDPASLPTLVLDEPRVTSLDDGLFDVPLRVAQARGVALDLPEPRGVARHELSSLPAYLAHVTNALGDDA